MDEHKVEAGTVETVGIAPIQAGTDQVLTPSGRCYNCGKEGHRVRECKSLTTQAPTAGPGTSDVLNNNTNTSICFNCGESGHSTENCPRAAPVGGAEVANGSPGSTFFSGVSGGPPRVKGVERSRPRMRVGAPQGPVNPTTLQGRPRDRRYSRLSTGDEGRQDD